MLDVKVPPAEGGGWHRAGLRERGREEVVRLGIPLCARGAPAGLGKLRSRVRALQASSGGTHTHTFLQLAETLFFGTHLGGRE